MSITPSGVTAQHGEIARDSCPVPKFFFENRLSPHAHAPHWPVNFDGVTLKDPGCPFYGLGFADELKVLPAPVKYRVRLALCGIRPISNIVDVTNYVMLFLGQPLHAFDFDKLPAPEITVRSSREGEKDSYVRRKGTNFL